MDKICGIYKITNKTNGKYYIGSSADIYTRWKQHKYFLNRNAHQNAHLQRAWNKYGQLSFDFIIIKSNVVDLLAEEQNHLDNVDKKLCYNASFVAGKVEMTDNVKQKISKSLTGRKIPYRPCNPEHVKKRVKSRQWYKHNQATKNKISLAKTGTHASEETKRKMSEMRKGSIPHNVDQTFITFNNAITNETFTGRKSDFIKKYNLFRQPVYSLINGNTKLQSYKGWKVMPNIP